MSAHHPHFHNECTFMLGKLVRCRNRADDAVRGRKFCRMHADYMRMRYAAEEIRDLAVELLESLPEVSEDLRRRLKQAAGRITYLLEGHIINGNGDKD